MEKDKKCAIPYKEAMATGAFIFYLIFGLGDNFPLWCEYLSIAIFAAVPLSWSVYAFIQKDKRTAIKYLLISTITFIVLTLVTYYLQ